MAKRTSGKTKKTDGNGKTKTTVRLLNPVSERSWVRESFAIFLVAISVFLLVSLLTQRLVDGKLFNSCGPAGRWIAEFLWRFFGITAFIFPGAFCFWGVLIFRHRTIRRKLTRITGIMGILMAVSMFLGVIGKAITYRNIEYTTGGFLGSKLAGLGIEYLDKAGSIILSLAVLLSMFLIATDFSYYLTTHRIKLILKQIFLSIKSKIIRSYERWSERRYYKKEQEAEKKAMEIEELHRSRMTDDEEDTNDEMDDNEQVDDIEPAYRPGYSAPIISISRPVYEKAQLEENPEEGEPNDEDDIDDDRFADSSFKNTFIATQSIHYQLPELTLLEDPPQPQDMEDEAELLKKSEILVKKLNDFSIQGRVTEVCPGPVITRFEFEPAPGIKISKITSLSDDLALAMKSKGLIRVAAVPGKSALGVEIPNVKRNVVSLKELLASDEYRTLIQKSLLALPLGKDISGNPFIADLKKMPHLLIAGATGSGKSVCINAILCGLLFTATPYELRLLLIDPKMLELSDYNGIPHLREPVITDVKKAPDALTWAVDEMNRRYAKLASMGARNIDQYNEKVTQASYSGPEKKLPYLVIIIDELADLMLTTPAVVEECIQRLAQMARASGIHLIIATQRPSVDVITGVIKANFPCRLAFQVASRVDSRTILDSIGAEKLLGMGDSLFIPPGMSQPMRLHGAFINDKEIRRIVEYLRQQPLPEQEVSIFKSIESEQQSVSETDDPLYTEAVRLVLSSGLASISFLQRRLKVGHSRASRLIDIMELNAIVGPHNGSKTREILVDRSEYMERLSQMDEEESDEP